MDCAPRYYGWKSSRAKIFPCGVWKRILEMNELNVLNCLKSAWLRKSVLKYKHVYVKFEKNIIIIE